MVEPKCLAPAGEGPSGVSVIICTWNRSSALRQTLAGLARQQAVPLPVEVLVVDNNSSDDTPAVLAKEAARWPLGELRPLFEGRQGKQFALNRGVQAARHDVLAFTDDDIHLPEDWLAQVCRIFHDGRVDLAGGRTLVDWTGVQCPSWYAPQMQAVLGGVDEGPMRLDPAPSTFAPGGGNLIAHRRTFERYGLYSESHFRHMDHEFGMRCQSRGAHVVYDPALVVWAPVDDRCLTRRYFTRWAFKAGIAGTGGLEAAGRVPHVPAWQYRRCLQGLWGWLWARDETESQRFARGLQCWRDAGAIANAWHAWLRPQAHAGWVQQRSQKKADVY